MKVLVATHSYSGNGAAVMLLAVMRHWIQDLGWTVDAMVDADADVPQELVELGVLVCSEPVPEQYDFVLVNTLICGGLVEVFAPRVPTALWIHEGETVVWNAEVLPARWLRMFQMPHRVVFQTRWQADAVFRSFMLDVSPDRIACVANGLPALPAGITPVAKVGGRRRIVFLGGVYGRKRPGDLVDALLSLDRNDIECIFVGGTADLNSLGPEFERKVRTRPDMFKLVGEKSRMDALSYLASADAFCLPSGDESQPVSPLEAAAVSVPSLLSDLAPYAGIWQHGRNCLLHPVGDVALLGWNVTAVLEDEGLRRTIVGGSQALLNRFSLPAFLRRFTAEMPV
jgi:glycosyltransferase involved in cell wall biosynthesis